MWVTCGQRHLTDDMKAPQGSLLPSNAASLKHTNFYQVSMMSRLCAEKEEETVCFCSIVFKCESLFIGPKSRTGDIYCSS